jgi:hypothetical protein
VLWQWWGNRRNDVCTALVYGLLPRRTWSLSIILIKSVREFACISSNNRRGRTPGTSGGELSNSRHLSSLHSLREYEELRVASGPDANTLAPCLSFISVAR